MDFVILCGFLGSGKTTLISDFLGIGQARDTAVIVNDAGEINVDGAVIAEAGDLTLARLSNGCVCCSLTNDLLYTVESLVAQREADGLAPLRRIILECSGLSDPGPVIRSLAALAHLRFRVQVLSTYACAPEIDIGLRFKEAAAQLAAAHRVVLTKIDLTNGQQEIVRASQAVRQLAPLGEVLIEPDRAIRARRTFHGEKEDVGFLKQDSSVVEMLRNVEKVDAHPRLSIYQMRCSTELDWSLLRDWLENVVGRFGDRVLRIKGIVPLQGSRRPVLLQGVGEHIDQPRPIDVPNVHYGLFLVLCDAVPGELESIEPVLPGTTLGRLPRGKSGMGITAAMATVEGMSGYDARI